MYRGRYFGFRCFLQVPPEGTKQMGFSPMWFEFGVTKVGFRSSSQQGMHSTDSLFWIGMTIWWWWGAKQRKIYLFFILSFKQLFWILKTFQDFSVGITSCMSPWSQNVVLETISHWSRQGKCTTSLCFGNSCLPTEISLNLCRSPGANMHFRPRQRRQFVSTRNVLRL